MAFIKKREGKRGPSWNVIINVPGGKQKSKTFKTSKDAKAWAAQMESGKHSRGYIPDAIDKNFTFADAAAKHLEEVAGERYRKARDSEAMMERAETYVSDLETKDRSLQKHFKAYKTPIFKIRGKDIADFQTERFVKQGKSGSTVHHEVTFISSVFKRAIKQWGMESLTNPVDNCERVKPGEARDIRPTKEELEIIYEEAKRYDNRMPWFRPMVMWAAKVGLRASETARIEPADLKPENRLIFLGHNKTDFPRDIPISQEGWKILHSFEWGETTCFHVKAESMSTEWRDFKNDLIKEGKLTRNIRLHDLRHEAIAAYFDRKRPDGHNLLGIQDVRQITGHKKLDIMFRTYANKPDASSVTSIPGF